MQNKIITLLVCSGVGLTNTSGSLSTIDNNFTSISKPVISYDFQKTQHSESLAKIAFNNISLSKEKVENLIFLNSLREYGENWDGEGALPFSEELIYAIEKTIIQLRLQPEIFPLQDGGIQLEYGNVKGKYLEFEIYLDNVNVYKISEEHKRSRYSFEFDFDKITREVNWFENRV